jgi:peptide subunit release factor 1 (eRF1)
MEAFTEQGDDRHIEVWKIKKLILKLDEQQGNGTSFVSLYVSPTKNIQLATQ